jgi:hypothetical protein
MTSVKDILSCIGADTGGQASVLFHLFGFFRGRVPTDPVATTAQVSLLDHVKSLRGKHVHLNIIRVGIDNFTTAEVDRIDYAIFKARNIYRTVGLGIGRVEHWDVAAADAQGFDDLGSEGEAEDLTLAATAPNNGLDVFMVDNISNPDFVGLSPEGGPCDKDDKDMNGVVGGEVNRGADAVARTFAHEIGHYLGLGHRNGEPDNLMCQTSDANSIRNSVLLTDGQGDTVRGHCSVQNGC